MTTTQALYTASFTETELHTMIAACLKAPFDPWCQAILPRLDEVVCCRQSMAYAHFRWLEV